jgi:hypothetical protein
MWATTKIQRLMAIFCTDLESIMTPAKPSACCRWKVLCLSEGKCWRKFNEILASQLEFLKERLIDLYHFQQALF